MLKVFQPTDKDFSSNGDKVIIPTKAKVHKEDNGDFYLELTAPLTYTDYIVQDNIIVAPTPQGEQGFRVSDVEKTRTKIIAKCWHLFYDTENYVIADSYVVGKNCNAALDHLNSATDTPSPFSTISDINTVNSYRCVRSSLYEAIQTVLERWGGHLVRDNFTIKIMSGIGRDNGVTVRYAKNLKTITATENWDSVCTKILPVGKDGTLLDELYLYSNIQYEKPYSKVIKFEQNDIEEDDYKDADGKTDAARYETALKQDLKTQAIQYLEENCVPKVNYTLKANLEQVTDVGDVIQVIDERLGISLQTNLISYDYDCILGQYTEFEFGTFHQTLSGAISSMTSQSTDTINANLNTLTITLQDELNTATQNIWNALGNSNVIFEGDKILIVDKLPKETAKNVIMINSAGIGFSNTGINGIFKSAWTIDNVLNMGQINVINLTSDLIKGGTLKLGSNLNQNGQIEIYDTSNNLIASLTNGGLKMFGADGSYIVMNSDVGFVGYDKTGTKIYWVSGDEFHQKKSVIGEEITLCNKMRFLPIVVTDASGSTVNDGIGLVSV